MHLLIYVSYNDCATKGYYTCQKLIKIAYYVIIQFFTRTQDVNRGFGKFCSISCSSIYARSNEDKPLPNVTCSLCNIYYSFGDNFPFK